MSRTTDFLDGFFVGPEISTTGGGGSAPWGGEQHPQHQGLHRPRHNHVCNAFQPHTPDNSVDVVTTASICSSTTNNGDKDISGLQGSRGEADYKEVRDVDAAELSVNGGIRMPGGVNQNSGSDVSHSNDNVGYARAGVEPSISPVPSRTASNEAYVPLGPRYVPDLGQRPPHEATHPQQPDMTIQVGAASMARVGRVNETGGVSAAALQRGDGMVDQLLAKLGESKFTATLLLMHLTRDAPSCSPAADILSRLVAHLEEGIASINQSRELLPPFTAANGGTLFHGVPNDALQDPTRAPQQQAQLRRQQFQPPAVDMPLFPGPLAPARYNDRGIWFSPLMPGLGGDNGGMMEGGYPTVTVGGSQQPHSSTVQRQQQRNQQRHRQQQRTAAPKPKGQFGLGVLSSNQMTPHANGCDPAHGAAYDGSLAPAFSAGDESLPAFTPAAGPGAACVDGTRGGNTGNGNSGAGDGILGPGGDGLIRGPPPRPTEVQFPPGSGAVDPFLAFVEFKRGRVRKYECQIDITPGQYVMVDGDRGRDCGLVVQTIKEKPDGTAALYCMDGCNVNSDKVKLEKGRVLGVATAEEIDYMHHTMQKAERIALETCRRVCDDLGININLLDCEYQFDMEKVSFYFNSEHSVDFRPLVRELYRTFRVRIWMENTNPRVRNSMPTDNATRRASIRNASNNNYNNGDDSDGAWEDTSARSDCGDNGRKCEGTSGGKRRGCHRGTQRQAQGKRSDSDS